MFKLIKFSISDKGIYLEEPLECFDLFSFEYSLEAAKSRILNSSWVSHPGIIYDKQSKRHILTKPAHWSFKNYLIKKIS